jgi:Aspartyl protease
MSSWSYQEGLPLVPVRVFGKELSIGSLALIDTGAKSCVMHESLVRALGLRTRDRESSAGFGGRRPFRAELVEAHTELAGEVLKVRFASIGGSVFLLQPPRLFSGETS